MKTTYSAARLKLAMREAHYADVRTLSRAADVGLSTLYRCVHGQEPNLTTLRKLASTLGVCVDFLYTATGRSGTDPE